MLTLRPEQLEIFIGIQMEEFLQEAIEFLREDYPEETAEADDDELRELIRLSIKKAGQYGIEIEDDVLEYLDRMMLYGDDFDKDDTFGFLHPILQDQTLDSSEKIEAIEAAEAEFLGAEGD